jgi:hypothetical protein
MTFTWKLNTDLAFVNLKDYNGGKGTYLQVVVPHLDDVSLSGWQVGQGQHFHWHGEDVQVAAKQAVANRAAAHSAVTHNLDTDDRRRSRRD